MERQNDKRQHYTLTEEAVEEIAERAATKAYEKMTTQVFMLVGKSVIERVLWIIGAILLWLYFYLQSKGIIK